MTKNLWSQATVADKLYGTNRSTLKQPPKYEVEDKDRLIKGLQELFEKVKLDLDPHNWQLIEQWEEEKKKYTDPVYSFKVRDKEIKIKTHTESLSHTQIPKVSLEIKKLGRCIVSGSFGRTFLENFHIQLESIRSREKVKILPECLPEKVGRTYNRRFHYVSLGMPAARLSTAFDSVTLYGNDPDYRPDIYGKIGNSGVEHLLS